MRSSFGNYIELCNFATHLKVKHIWQTILPGRLLMRLNTNLLTKVGCLVSNNGVEMCNFSAAWLRRARNDKLSTNLDKMTGRVCIVLLCSICWCGKRHRRKISTNSRVDTILKLILNVQKLWLSYFGFSNNMRPTSAAIWTTLSLSPVTMN